jgi:hypothetical protein
VDRPHSKETLRNKREVTAESFSPLTISKIKKIDSNKYANPISKKTDPAKGRMKS